MADPEREVVHSGRLFRFEHQEVSGISFPYEYVTRIPATTVLSITNIDGRPHVIGIRNTRAVHGTLLGLPGGNADGGFGNFEDPTITGLRELREETGYGYPEGVDPNVDTFLLHSTSFSLHYNRFFSIARGVSYVGGEEHNEHERIELMLEPQHLFLRPLIDMKRSELYAEVNAGFAKAAREVGPLALHEWVEHGSDYQNAQSVIASLEPWMHIVPQQLAS